MYVKGRPKADIANKSGGLGSSGASRVKAMECETKHEATIPVAGKGEKDDEQPSFETLLDTVGHIGRYQLLIMAIMKVAEMMSALVMMYLVFGLATPTWWCAEFEGLNITQDLNWTEEDRSFEKTCELNGSRCIRYEFDPRYTSIVTEWGLVCDNKYIPKLTTSILFLGVLVGVLLASQISDLFGRKKVIVASGFLMISAQIVVGFSPNWQVHATLRFVVGIFLGPSLAIGFLAPMEFIGPRWRSLNSASSLWDLGSSMTALVAYLLPNWRHQAFAAGIFIPLMVAITVVLPESIRWLIQKSRFEEASKLLRRFAKANRKPVPDLRLLEKIHQAQHAEREKEARYTYLDLFSTRKLAARTLVVMFCWFTGSCVYYVITVGVSNLSGDIYLNMVYSSLPNTIIGLLVFPVTNYFGRKRAYYIYISVPIVAMLTTVILFASGAIGEHSIVVTILAIVGKILILETWTVAALISAEIYPTLMRAIALGMGSMAARVGGVMAPQIVLLGDAVHWVIPYIINGCLAVGSVILVAVIIPETNGKPLPEELPPPNNCLRRFRCGGTSQKEQTNRLGNRSPREDGEDSKRLNLTNSLDATEDTCVI